MDVNGFTNPFFNHAEADYVQELTPKNMFLLDQIDKRSNLLE